MSGFCAQCSDQDRQTRTVWSPRGATPGQRDLGGASAGTRADLPSEPVFVFQLPRRGLRGCLEPQLFFIASRLKKSPEHIFREKGRKGIFSFLTQEEDLLQFPICLPCWAELAGESPKGTPPGGNQVDELMGRLSRDSDTMPASPNRQMHVRTCTMEARGAMCWIKDRGAGRTGGHWGPKFHQKV